GGGGGFVDVVPDAPQSGLLVQRMVDQAGLDVRTDRPRTGYYYFYLKEYLDEYGGSHEVAPPQLLAEGETPFPSLFANAFTGFEGASLAESQLDPPLLLVPEGTNIQQVYDLVVTGAHFPDLTPEPAWVASHPNPDRDVWRQKAARMPALAFVKDVLLPSLFSVTVPRALREVETNITAESAQVFVGGMATYDRNLHDLVDSGEWQRAAVLVLRRCADDETARERFIDQVNAWTGLRFDIEYGLFYFWSMLQRAESYYDAILEGFSNFDITGVASAARDAERMDLWEITFDTATIALATGRGYVSRELNELRIRHVIPRVPENYCVRWVLDGAGSLAEWVQGEAPNPVGTELWTGGEIVYVVDPGDVVAGSTATITAELYDEICDLAPGSEPIGTASAVIEQRELNLDPCEGFDLEFWQEGTTSPDWTFDLLTPVIAGGDDIVIEVTNNRNVTAEVTLYIPCVYVNGNSPYPGTEHVSVTGAGPNVNYFVVDNDAMWHWRRQDVVGYPLVSWGIILRIQTIDPLATFTVTVPTTEEFSESAHFRPCPDFGPWGPGGTTALGSLGFIGDSNYNWFDRMIIVE
ncbi:MAG: hypothetical protein KC591_03480, partial [Gemmatimonadetes bacterium]|nr:hypothetical protein [Gemmatimonadota bacterium]